VVTTLSCFLLDTLVTGNWETGIMNFTTRKTKPVKQRYKNPKRKLNKWEEQFIETHGRKLYDQLRASRSELRKRPHEFKLMIKSGELFGIGFYHFLIKGDS
jgi:hypothetical protein